MNTASPTLYVIDGNSQMYRAYHAIRGLSSPDGTPSNAVFGFVAMLRKLIDDHRPSAIVSAFDLAGPTFRDELAPDYKANRAPMPDDLVVQVPLVHRASEALGSRVLTCQGFEADDVIGTVAVKGQAAGFRVVIVTGDKDMLQLVNDSVVVFNPRDDGTWLDADGVKQRFGVPPDRIVDLLALTGDSADNIAGVPGIGEKGAVELLARFGSLDELLAHAGEVTQKRYREGLIAHADLARQSRELARIRTDAPVEVDLESFRYVGPDRAACYELFASLGFRTLTSAFAPVEAAPVRDYALVTDEGELASLIAEVAAAGRVAVHVVAGEGPPRKAPLVGLAFATAPGRARYLPVGHTGLESAGQIDRRRALASVASALADPAVRVVAHDVKAAMLVLAREGIAPGGEVFDTLIASYLLDADRSSHEVAPLALEQLGYRAVDEETVRGKGARAIDFADVPMGHLMAFASERADVTWRLAERFEPSLAQAGLEPVWRELERPLSGVLAGLERAGIRVDTRALAGLGARVRGELDALAARIHEAAGGRFNINSPKQLAEVLFDRLHLPVTRKTGKTRSPSTSVEVLEELAASHDLPRLILEWRSLQKLHGTYIEALPSLVDPDTGRVHTSFNQAVAATGRLSSSDPNLQNIPVRTSLGREIRAAFVADPGSVLVSADYSQIELRVLAHLSGDEALGDAFGRGEDIHDRTARKVFGEASGLDPYELRRRAKIINYALVYGRTAFSLARDIGVSQQAAQEFIDAYFAGFPGVRRFIDRTLEQARATGEVRTLAGRRRLVPDINSPNAQVRAAAERVAVNMPVQGTAADILKRAMIDLDRALRDRAGEFPATRMILTVHDELVFETPSDRAAALAALVGERMQRAASLSVPLTVDVGIGPNWNDAKP